MKAIGFNIGGGTLRWVVASGTRALPVMAARGRCAYDTAGPLEARMSEFQKTFASLLAEHAPDAAAYRMHMGRTMTQEQVATYHYPWGVLLLECSRAGIAAAEFTGASLTAKRFGLAKGSKPMDAVDEVMGTHPPHWDDQQRYAACAAWGALP